MMVSEERRNGDVIVTTGDMRSVTLHGDEVLAEEIVRWWDHFKRLLKDLPVCPFCELPILDFEQDRRDPLTDGAAHLACVEDWQLEADREMHFMERFDLELPPPPQED